MAVTRLPQQHVDTEGSSIDDTLTPTNHDGNAVDLADTVDFLASQIADITGETAWETAPDASIATIMGKTFLDEKLALRWVPLLTDTTVPNGQNYKVLVVASSETPAGKVKATGASTVGLPTVVHGGSFGAAHSLAEIAGKSTLFPKNILRVWDGTTGDALESSSRQVYALLQNESGATDGTAFTDTTPQRSQISFVRPNATYDDLEACPVADIEDKVVNCAFVDRAYMDSFTEQDFLDDVEHIDLGIAGSASTLNNAIDNQGATPATQTTDIFVRIDDDASWIFETSDGAVDMLKVSPAAAGDEVEINADTFDVNVGASGTIDFDNGLTADSGGTAINVGVTPGQIDSGAAGLKVASSGALVEVEGQGITLDGTAGSSGAITADGTALDADFSDDSHVIMAANDAGTKTVTVAARNAGAGDGDLYLEADNDVSFETAQETSGIALDDSTAGAISGLFGQSFTSISAAIKYAGDTTGDQMAMKVFPLGSSYAKDANIPAATLDLTAYTLDMGSNAATVFVYYNGRLLRGAAAVDTADIYPGTTPASGDLKHSFPASFVTGGVLISIGFA